MPELTAEIMEILVEYTQLQREEQQIKTRKQALQEKLKLPMRNGGKNVWFPKVGGAKLKISYRIVPQVEYDEEKLKGRLGERYRSLLEPDLRKLRAQLPNLANELEPLLDRVGSPSPDKIRSAIANGTVSAEAFKGAFTKTIKEYIAVATLNEPAD